MDTYMKRFFGSITRTGFLLSTGAAAVSAVLLLSAIRIHSADFAYFNYVQEPLNPRCIALGGAGTALSYGGFAFYNPAAAAFAERSFVSLDFGQQWSDLTRGSVETAWVLDRWFIGGTFVGRTVDYPLADETGILPGSGASQETMLSLFTGLRHSRYSVGIAANALPHFIGGENAFAVSASGGVSALVIPGKLTVGAALLQAGRYHRGFYSKEFSAHRDSMSTMVRAGAAYNDIIKGALPFTVTADIEYEYGEDRLMVPAGIEFRPLEPVAIRIGKRFNHYSDVMTFGIGLHWENIAFDAAFVPTVLDETVNRSVDWKWLMGVRYELPRRKGEGKRTSIKGDATLVTPQPDPSGKDSTMKNTSVREPEQPASLLKNGEEGQSDSISETEAAATGGENSSVNTAASNASSIQSAVSGNDAATTDSGSTDQSMNRDGEPGTTGTVTGEPVKLPNDKRQEQNDVPAVPVQEQETGN